MSNRIFIVATASALAILLHLSPLTTYAQQGPRPSMIEQSLKVAPGDVIAQQDKSGTWRVIKILQVDSFPDDSPTAHCLSYDSSESKPTAASLATLGVRVWHAPIAASSFGKGWERIASQAVLKDELVGFVEYLKLTDFPRYIAFTGQDSKQIVRAANEHYKRAYHLGDKGLRNLAKIT